MKNGISVQQAGEKYDGGCDKKAPMDTADDWAKMVKVMKSKVQCGNMTMCGNEDLFMFYLSQFMRECVYYIGQSDTYVIAEIDGNTLMIHAIFGEASVDEVIASFGSAIRRTALFFTPTDRMGYDTRKRLLIRRIPRFLLRERCLKQSGMINLCFRLLRMRKTYVALHKNV